MSKKKISNELIELPFNQIFFKLAIPNICATFLSASTVIFDLWYIGKIGMTELAGVAYIFPIFMLTSMLSNGAFGGAISGATARAFGSKNLQLAECIFRSAILISLFGSLLMMLLFFAISERFFIFMNIDQEVSSAALSYGNILLGGIFLIWLFNIIISVTRGSGNTIIPAFSWLIVLSFHVLLASFNFVYIDGNFILKNNVIFLNENYLFNSLEWSAISLLSGYFFWNCFYIRFLFLWKSFIFIQIFKNFTTRWIF